MRTPEQIEAARKALAFHDAGKIKCYSDDPAERYDVQKMLAEALRALIDPQFKPDDQPDKYRSLWERGAYPDDSAKWVWLVEVSGPRSAGTLEVTRDQARRILAMLSEESEA